MTLVGVYKILPSGNDDEVEQTLQNLVCKMFIVGRAVCFILALIATVIAVITNSQNHTRRVPPPKPFFTRETWVEDFYEGELYYALLKSTKYDVIFLMLYAPWDADSQKARSEFESACRYFHNKVYCAAVNCWQANTRCKAVFDNIATYPMFLVDLYNVPSIKYNGEFIASHMIRFLSTIMKPLERINSVEKFQTLNTMCDTLVVSFLPDYKWYRRYYTASLRHIEYDPRRDICWSVITDPVLAHTLDVKPFSVKLHTWNETKVYGHSFVDKHIAKWVHDNTNFLTRWLFFKNARSTSLAELLENKPAVILFTPRNMYLNHIPSYLVFKEAALEFKSCFYESGIENSKPTSAEQWQRIIEEHHEWEHVCKRRFSLKNASYNSTIFDLIRQNYEKYVFTSMHLENTTTWDSLPNTCDASRKSTLGAEVITSMLDSSKDDRSPQNLVLRHIREKCRQLNMLKSTFDYSYFTNTPSFSKPESVFSASCRANKTFSFFAVDSLLNSHFATALGVNLENYEDRTAVVIFDNRNEETYVLAENLSNTITIHEFLVSFALRTAPRWIKSTEDSSLYLNRYNRLENPTRDEVVVLELNSRTFESVVFDLSQHVVVYFYSPYCGYCQVSAYTFLSAAYKLRNIPQITFARVDGENNDLPWHLVPLHYPTIMIFPANKKSESVVFPQSLEITAENVYEFLLSNVDAEIRLAAMLDECNQYKNTRQVSRDAFDECVTRVKTYCLQLINKLVSKYKNVAVNATAAHDEILSRLKFFKTFYLSTENL